MDDSSPIKEFNEKNIINYNYTFGSIARDILKRSGVFGYKWKLKYFYFWKRIK